ncbi:hypothetical protein [Pseudomonas sp. LB3P14]
MGGIIDAIAELNFGDGFGITTLYSPVNYKYKSQQGYTLSFHYAVEKSGSTKIHVSYNNGQPSEFVDGGFTFYPPTKTMFWFSTSTDSFELTAPFVNGRRDFICLSGTRTSLHVPTDVESVVFSSPQKMGLR